MLTPFLMRANRFTKNPLNDRHLLKYTLYTHNYVQFKAKIQKLD